MDSRWGTTATTTIFVAAAITDWLDGYIARKVCNSLVFQTVQRDSEYSMALVSERFLDDVPFYLPGASLTPSNWLYYGDELSVNLTEYTDHQSAIWQITFTMATDGSRWDNISVNECYNEYFAVSQLSRTLILACQASPNTKTSWLRLIGIPFRSAAKLQISIL